MNETVHKSEQEIAIIGCRGNSMQDLLGKSEGTGQFGRGHKQKHGGFRRRGVHQKKEGVKKGGN